MADKVHRAYLWLFAWVALLLGCVLTANALSRLANCRAGMERRMAEHKSLAELDERLRHMETAMATWQERQPGPPAPISVLATNIFADMKVDIREVASSNAAPGLVARRIEVACQDVPFDKAMQLVQRLDGLWPRWVLVHLEIKSTDQVGRGTALMRFETVSSATAAPPALQPQPPAHPAATGPDGLTAVSERVEMRNPTSETPRAEAATQGPPRAKVWHRP